jgi:hypothetical protein
VQKSKSANSESSYFYDMTISQLESFDTFAYSCSPLCLLQRGSGNTPVQNEFVEPHLNILSYHETLTVPVLLDFFVGLTLYGPEIHS